MKKNLFVLITLIIVIFFIATPIYTELNSTCSINDKFTNPVENTIQFDLQKRFNQDVKINSIDGNVEDNSRIVTFTLNETQEEKTVLYLGSFLPNRIKYIDEIKNIDKYKDFY